MTTSILYVFVINILTSDFPKGYYSPEQRDIGLQIYTKCNISLCILYLNLEDIIDVHLYSPFNLCNAGWYPVINFNQSVV